jgi:F-type H+-transporting ATPase subunit delta
VSLSRRYAKALLEIAQKTNSVEATASSLIEMDQAFRNNPELREVLRNPGFLPSQRKAILENVLKASGAPEHLVLFLGFMFDRERINILSELTIVFRRLADEQTGTVRGEIISAAPLPDHQKDLLQSALNRATGNDVKFTVQQDPSLLGGAVARVGDMVFDGSVRTQLRQMRSTLLGE